MWPCNWVVEKIWITFRPKSGGKSLKMCQGCCFWHFFDPPEPQPGPIPTKIGTHVGHHSICVNLIIFKGFLTFTRGSDMSKMAKIWFLHASLENSSLALSQAAMLKWGYFLSMTSSLEGKLALRKVSFQ